MLLIPKIKENAVRNVNSRKIMTLIVYYGLDRYSFKDSMQAHLTAFKEQHTATVTPKAVYAEEMRISKLVLSNLMTDDELKEAVIFFKPYIEKAPKCQFEDLKAMLSPS
jgi:hypothetical protein